MAEIKMQTIVAHLHSLGLTNAHVAHTGGGVATIYGGPVRIEGSEDIRYAVVAGPGSYDWAHQDHTADTEDFCFGPDTDDYESYTVNFNASEMVIAVSIYMFVMGQYSPAQLSPR